MRECGKTSTEHVDPARRYPVGQGDEDGHHHDIGGEKNPDQPARLGFREVPARNVARQQRWQSEGADLRQHLRGHDRARIDWASGSEVQGSQSPMLLGRWPPPIATAAADAARSSAAAPYRTSWEIIGSSAPANSGPAPAPLSPRGPQPSKSTAV